MSEENEATGMQTLFPPTAAATPDAQGRFSIPLTFSASQADSYRVGIALDNQPSKVSPEATRRWMT